VHIDEMKLRLPGVTEKEAREIGEDVAKRIRESLPGSFQAKRVDTIDLRLSIPTGVSGSEMKRIIAEAVLKAML